MSDSTLVCSQCKGKGRVASAYNADQTVFVECPDCDGTGLVRERVERAAKAMWVFADPQDWVSWELLPEASKQRWRGRAVNAIKAYLAEEGDQ